MVFTPSRVLIGFDGFIDTLLYCVEQRTGPSSFRRLRTISQLSEKISAASLQSANIECVVKEQSIGGNAPLLARALASLGHPGTLIGTCGYPTVHPIFRPLETIGLDVHSFAEPGLTDALEFTDGKLLLGKMGELNSLTLQEARHRLSKNLLRTAIMHAEILATVNWTMMPIVQEFWEFLINNPSLLTSGTKKFLFVDLTDPAKRPVKDLKKAISTLSELNSSCNVILGLNRSESTQVLHALRQKPSSLLQKNASMIASTAQLSTVVIHTHPEVAVASSHEGNISSHSLSVPLCKKPVRSTGAGDTFNAGFLAGVLQQQPPEVCLHMAVAASGIFVRTGIPPTTEAVKAFTERWTKSSVLVHARG